MTSPSRAHLATQACAGRRVGCRVAVYGQQSMLEPCCAAAAEAVMMKPKPAVVKSIATTVVCWVQPEPGINQQLQEAGGLTISAVTDAPMVHTGASAARADHLHRIFTLVT